MENTSDKPARIFCEGLFFRKPESPNAPKSLKGSISVQAEKFIKFLRDHDSFQSEKGWVTINLWKSDRTGGYYFDLDQWKPKPKAAESAEADETPL